MSAITIYSENAYAHFMLSISEEVAREFKVTNGDLVPFSMFTDISYRALICPSKQRDTTDEQAFES